MANEYGAQYRVHFKTGASTFAAIGGELSFDWQRSSNEVDISDKDTGIYGATSFNTQKITFQISGNLKLPDAAFSAAFTASKALPPEIEMKVMKGDVVKFQGMVAIGNFSATFPKDGPATYSLNASNSAVPTVDDLTATV